MIGDLIHRHFGVRYHNHHVPWVLHRLGFSVQRPRKRLAPADLANQEIWLRAAFSSKNAARHCGVILFEDEASSWLDGTLHHTWAPVGQQPRVDTFGLRKAAHVYDAVSIDAARFTFQFASVFNAETYLAFLKLLVTRYPTRKIFLITDNGPCQDVNQDGKKCVDLRGAEHGAAAERGVTVTGIYSSGQLTEINTSQTREGYGSRRSTARHRSTGSHGVPRLNALARRRQ